MAQEFYVSLAKNNLSSTLGKILKKYAIRFYQLKISYGAIDNFLVKVGAIKTSKYWECGV